MGKTTAYSSSRTAEIESRGHQTKIVSAIVITKFPFNDLGLTPAASCAAVGETERLATPVEPRRCAGYLFIGDEGSPARPFKFIS